MRTKRLSYANVMSTIAVFLGLATGGAYAANTIGSADVIDDSLTSADIKNGEVKASDIGTDQVLGSRIVDGTIKSYDVNNNSLTGWDINESSLGNVPNASNAAFATSAGFATQSGKAPVEGYEVIWGSSPHDQIVRKVRSFEVTCPAGKRPIGGGGHARTTAIDPNTAEATTGAELAIIESYPSGGMIYQGYAKPTGWTVKAQATDRSTYNAGININAYVVCANTDLQP